jgi:hypothetical protein
MIRKRDLRGLLENNSKILAPNPLDRQKPVDANDLISLSVGAKRKRYGGEVLLVVPPSSDAPLRRPNRSLIKALARAHGWYENPSLGYGSSSSTYRADDGNSY